MSPSKRAGLPASQTPEMTDLLLSLRSTLLPPPPTPLRFSPVLPAAPLLRPSTAQHPPRCPRAARFGSPPPFLSASLARHDPQPARQHPPHRLARTTAAQLDDYPPHPLRHPRRDLDHRTSQAFHLCPRQPCLP